MKKLFLLCILLLVPLVQAVELNDYPDFFVDGSSVNVKIVVGDLALASDTIGAVEIATALQVDPFSNITRSPVEAVLASEIDDITQENLIVIGGPCANSVSAALLDFPQPCYSSISPNTALVKAFTFENGVSILVAGSSAIDTRRGSRVVANYQDYFFPASSTMKISRTLQKEILISSS